MKICYALTFILTLFYHAPVGAHEFWLEPQKFSAPQGTDIAINLKVGMEFQGISQIYLPQNIKRSEIIVGGHSPEKDKVINLSGRLGDVPAMRLSQPPSGLLIAAHETNSFDTKYETSEKFYAFLREKGLEPFINEHRKRGLPDQSFYELYSRHAKSFVVRGKPKGQDVKLGMLVEIFSPKNPFVQDISEELPLIMLYRNEPLPHHQVHIREKDEAGRVTLSTIFTDDTGTVKLKPRDNMTYLVDFVVLEPVDPQTNKKGAGWISRWASLTFKLP